MLKNGYIFWLKKWIYFCLVIFMICNIFGGYTPKKTLFKEYKICLSFLKTAIVLHNSRNLCNFEEQK